MGPPPLPLLLVAVAVVIGVGVVCSAPAPAELTQEQLHALFQQNIRRFRAFRCGVPQNRSVMVGELLLRQGRLLPSQLVLPPATVLHVCGPSTGCCYSADQVCAPLATEVVSLPFRVKNAVKGDAFAEMSLSFVNHTQCACMPRDTTSGDPEAIVILDSNTIPST